MLIKTLDQLPYHPFVSPEPYGAAWQNSGQAPTQHEVYSKISSLVLSDLGGSLPAAAITSGVFAPARLGTGSGGATKFLREDSTWQTVPTGITIGSTAISGGTNNRILYQSGGVVQQSSAITFDGTNLTFAPSYTYIQGTGLYCGGNNINTGFYFRGGSTGSNTYADFRMSAGGGSREWIMYNQLASKYALFITGGSDAQNVNNTMVAVGHTAPVAQFSVRPNTTGRNIFELMNSSGVVMWRMDSNGDTTFGDGCDISTGTMTGSQWGTSNSQKQAWWGATPITQPTDVGTMTIPSIAGSDTVDAGALADALNDMYAIVDGIRSRMRTMGLMA